MGMYDSVIFKCPNCGTEIEEQSKAGECILQHINENEVPLDIARSIEGGKVECSSCNSCYVIEVPEMPKPLTVVAKLRHV